MFAGIGESTDLNESFPQCASHFEALRRSPQHVLAGFDGLLANGALAVGGGRRPVAIQAPVLGGSPRFDRVPGPRNPWHQFHPSSSTIRYSFFDRSAANNSFWPRDFVFMSAFRPALHTPSKWGNLWTNRAPLEVLNVELADYRVQELDGVQGFLVQGDVETLFRMALELPRGGRYLEIGTWEGLSALIVAHGLLANLNLRAEITCIDIWEGNEGQHRRFEKFKEHIHRLGLVDYFTSLRMTSDEAFDVLHDQRYDMIFNDSVTTLDGRYHDVMTWRQRLTPNGRMFGHDCLPGSPALAGLEKAAAELGAEVLIHPGTHGLWELRPRNGWDGSRS